VTATMRAPIRAWRREIAVEELLILQLLLQLIDFHCLKIVVSACCRAGDRESSAASIRSSCDFAYNGM